MSRTRIARAIGLVAIVLLNLAILALPSRAGWYDTTCLDDEGEAMACCAWCVICWGCDFNQEEN
jgi:hypothetical protein